MFASAAKNEASRMKARMVAMSSAEHLPPTNGLPHQACGSLLALMRRQLQVASPQDGIDTVMYFINLGLISGVRAAAGALLVLAFLDFPRQWCPFLESLSVPYSCPPFPFQINIHPPFHFLQQLPALSLFLVACILFCNTNTFAITGAAPAL